MLLENQTKAFELRGPPTRSVFYHSSTVSRHFFLAQAWTDFPQNVIAGLLSTIRNRILNFVLEIMEENPNAGEAAIGSRPVSDDKASKIFHSTIHIHGNVNNLTSGNVEIQNISNEVHAGDLESLKGFLMSAGIPDPDISDLEVALSDEPEGTSIESAPKTLKWWEGISHKVSSGAIKLTTAVMHAGAVEFIKKGVDAFFPS